MIDPRQLIGRKNNDPADVLACMDKRYLVLPPGVSPFDWESPGRLIPDPPSVEGGPFSEIRLAGTSAAAWAAQVGRRVAASEQPIWQVLNDVCRYPLYRIEAPGARIKDCHADGRLAGGAGALRKRGEDAQVHEDRSLVALGAAATSEVGEGDAGHSIEWRALDRFFREPIVAVSLPDDPRRPAIRLDWPVIASVPRVARLADEGLLSIVYVGVGQTRMRDLLRLTDANGAPAGLRFACFLARELARDFFSLSRPRSTRDRIAIAVTLLTSIGAIAGLVSRLIELLS